MKTYYYPLKFLVTFLLIYATLNSFYSLWVSSWGTSPDPATQAVTRHTSFFLNVLGQDSYFEVNPVGPTVRLKEGQKVVLNVFEGCNGISVVVVFVSFLVAFGGRWRAMLWFAPFGIIIIYASNIVRVLLLYWVSRDFSRYFYYVHKYFFTAAIYGVVFVLWWIWVEKVNRLLLRNAVA